MYKQPTTIEGNGMVWRKYSPPTIARACDLRSIIDSNREYMENKNKKIIDSKFRVYATSNGSPSLSDLCFFLLVRNMKLVSVYYHQYSILAQSIATAINPD